MSYRLEGKDIVLSGIQAGIASSPYDGIADMRNIEILNIPGEGSVNFKEVPAIVPPALNNIAYTADTGTDRLTAADVTGLYEGCAISLTPISVNADYLVIGGGGGGGGSAGLGSDSSGGGGAGQMLDSATLATTTPISTSENDVAITVGAGGAGGAATGLAGSNGSPSSIGSAVTALGGGGGGGDTAPSNNGQNGGSGGGAGNNGAAGTGTTPGGNAGGGTGSTAGGGGGGAGAAGQAASGPTVGGNGGNGAASSISGASVTYAGGGGGASNTTMGTGGTGGGGNAAQMTPGAGTANTGSGGGGTEGGAFVGGAEGSGVVVIAYTTGALNATGGVITTAGGKTIHTFNSSGTLEVSGLPTGKVFYVRNIVGSTFQLSESPLGSIYAIPFAGSGTFTTYQYGNQRGIINLAPLSYFVDLTDQSGGGNGIYLVDGSNYAWYLSPTDLGLTPAYHLVFLGNIGGAGASGVSGNGVVCWKGYIFIFWNSGVDIMDLNDWLFDGPLASWVYSWWSGASTQSFNGRISALVAQDDVIYYTSDDGVGSIGEVAGETFDPTDNTTYTTNDAALAIPADDRSTCLAELSTNLLVGGILNAVYPWDRVSTSFNYPIIVPDRVVSFIVGTNQNAYVFAGDRGRIYITNGSAIDLYKKLPDYVTGIIRPYFQWNDASFNRNQLYFSFRATQNDDTLIQTVNGCWAIDLGTDALRMINKTTRSDYAGRSTMVTEMPAATPNGTDNPSGTAMTIGWTYAGPPVAFGIDRGDSVPYDNFEAFIEWDIIPIGTLLDVFTPSQFEWKVSQPLGGNGTPESIRLYARQNINDAFVLIGTTTLSGPTAATVALSDVYYTNFQKAQWLQIRLEASSNATTPTFCRTYEVRIRDFEAK